MLVGPAVDRTLDDVAQFADIAGPVVGLQHGHGFGREAGPGIPFQFGGHAPSVIVGQFVDIAFPRPQRRQVDDLEAQAIEQVRPESAFLCHARQVGIGGGDYAHVDLDRARSPDPGDLPVFDRAQEPLLRRHGQSAEFVEKQRAPIGFLETPGPRPHGPGERSGLVPEQFRLDQRLRQGGAVHGDERLAPAR